MASSKVMYSSTCIALICGFLASVAVLATAKPLDYGALFSSAGSKGLSPRMSLAAALSSSTRPQYRQRIINNNQLVGSDGGSALGSSAYADRVDALYRDLLYGPYAREDSPVADLGDKQYAAATAAEVPSMEQLQDLKALLADYDAVYGNGNGNTDNDYFQSEQPVNGGAVADEVGAIYGDVAPAAASSNNYLTEAREGTWLDGPCSATTEDPLDDLLLNYFLQHYRDLTSKGSSGGSEDGGESDIAAVAAAVDQLESRDVVEKRRQKVVIKDQEQLVSSSTASPPVRSTAAPTTSITARKPKLGPLAKAKSAATNTNTNRRGQKEVALLRPAEAKPKQQQQDQEWPSELDENNLEEEEQSLKELSESMRAQSRPVRDVLTSQLDSLKTETQ
ncbi:hypothetical protein TYRP_000620, partial [Tyrophagus putrescentiae]